MNEAEILSKYVGIPYRHRGRGMDGLDCWGLALLIYRDLGVELWDLEGDYETDWHKRGQDHFAENYHREWLVVSEARFPDGVLFMTSRGIANHSGVVLSDGKFIHATKHGVVVSRLSDEPWKSCRAGFYRHKRLS